MTPNCAVVNGEDEVQEGTPTQQRPGCRDMLQGVYRLLFRRNQVEVAQRAEVSSLLPLRMIEPLKKNIVAELLPMSGTLPDRAMELHTLASSSDLHFRFTWYGMAELHGFGMLIQGDGRLIQTVWKGANQSLQSFGVQVQTFGDTLQMHRAGVVVHPDKIPPTAFACIIGVLAGEEGMVRALNLYVDIATSAWGQPFWKYAKDTDTEGNITNALALVVLYRGRDNRWRLEPLCLKAFILGVVGDHWDDAILKRAAEAFAWKVCWLVKDRHWRHVCDSRGILLDKSANLL